MPSPATDPVHWIPDDFTGLDVPEETQRFLIDIGLPEGIPFTEFEFSPFRCEWPELVIGVDDEYPILVDDTGSVTVAYEDGPWFFNSSVQLLGQAITLFDAVRAADDTDTARAEALATFRTALAAADPACFSEEHPQSVWKAMIDSATAEAEEAVKANDEAEAAPEEDAAMNNDGGVPEDVAVETTADAEAAPDENPVVNEHAP